MAHTMQVALLVLSALMMSLSECSAQGAGDRTLVSEEDQTLVSEIAHRALLQSGGTISFEKPKSTPPKTGIPYCKDRASYSKCSTWKYNGWCKNKYFQWYSVPYYWCPKTCSKCSCYDQPGYDKLCKKWYSQGYCKPGYWYTYYKVKTSIHSTLCPYTCKYCTKSGPKY